MQTAALGHVTVIWQLCVNVVFTVGQVGHGVGDGEGLGTGLGDGDGLGLGVGVGVGLGLGDGSGLGLGEGDGWVPLNGIAPMSDPPVPAPITGEPARGASVTGSNFGSTP